MEMIQAGSTPEIDIELFAEADISQTTPIDISQFSDFEIWLVDSRNKRIFAKYSREVKPNYLPIEIPEIENLKSFKIDRNYKFN
jgi:hypothetical protein